MSLPFVSSSATHTAVQSVLPRLAMAIARRRSYADGHPMAEQADGALTQALTDYLADEPALALGVANRELLLNDTLLSANGNVVRDLATRLHGMGIGAIRIQRGVTQESVTELVRLLSRRANDPTLQDALPIIPLISLGRIDYEQLGLVDEEADRVESAQLWRALAERIVGAVTEGSTGNVDHTGSGSGGSGGNSADVGISPEGLAATLGGAESSEVVAQRAFDALESLADGVATAPRAVRETIGERLQELLSASEHGAIVATLRVAERQDRTRLVQNVVNVLPAAAVVRWLRAAATASGHDLSPHLLRLLSKMSVHFRGRRKAAADEALRETAAELVSGWEGGVSNPGEHAALLDTLAEWTAREGGSAASGAQPLDSAGQEAARLVQMACELDLVSADVALAVRTLADNGHSNTVLLWADRARSEETRRRLRDMTLTPAAISQALLATPFDSAAAKQLLDATNEEMAPVLIDALERCESRAGRRLIFDRLRTMNSSISDAVRARLAAPMPWFLARNLLSLLRDLWLAAPEPPTQFPTGPLLLFQRHEHVAVRREAVRLLAGLPALRTAALRRALEDSATDVQHAAIDMAYALRKDELPSDVAMRLLALAEQDAVPADLREKAIRAVSGTKQSAVVQWLVAHCSRRARLTGSLKLAPVTESVRAALHVLSTTYADDQAAAAVLALARKNGVLGARA